MPTIKEISGIPQLEVNNQGVSQIEVAVLAGNTFRFNWIGKYISSVPILLLCGLMGTGEAIFSNPAIADSSTNVTQFPLPNSVPKNTIIKIDGSTSMATINQALKNYFENKYAGSQVKLQYQGTNAALKSVLEGKVDIAAIGRPLTAEEKAKGLVSTALPRRKIAIIVGQNNPFKGNLTTQQVAKIFRGEIKNWSEVGSHKKPIRLIDRPQISDTRQTLLQEYSLLIKPQGNNVVKLANDSTAAIIEKLGGDSISYAIADQAQNQPKLRVIPMYNVDASAAKYPFSQKLYYVYKNSPTPPAKYFLGVVKAPVGQQTIAKATKADAKAIAAGSLISTNIKPDSTKKVVPTNNTVVNPVKTPSPTALPNSDLAQITPSPTALPNSNLAQISKEPNIDWLWWLLPIGLLVGLALLIKNRSRKTQLRTENPQSEVKSDNTRLENSSVIISEITNESNLEKTSRQLTIDSNNREIVEAVTPIPEITIESIPETIKASPEPTSETDNNEIVGIINDIEILAKATSQLDAQKVSENSPSHLQQVFNSNKNDVSNDLEVNPQTISEAITIMKNLPPDNSLGISLNSNNGNISTSPESITDRKTTIYPKTTATEKLNRPDQGYESQQQQPIGIQLQIAIHLQIDNTGKEQIQINEIPIRLVQSTLPAIDVKNENAHQPEVISLTGNHNYTQLSAESISTNGLNSQSNGDVAQPSDTIVNGKSDRIEQETIETISNKVETPVSFLPQTQWKTLWQIGQPSGENTNSRVGIRPKPGGWTPEYDYVVETDADPINQPKLPCFLLSDEALTAAKLASTDKLNIHFQLFQDYQAGELLLLCDRYGAETDSVFIDGQLISEIVGIAEGELQQNSIPLPALASGEHRISLTTSGGTGRHAIDHLQLREANTSKTLWQIGKPHDESSDSRHGIRPMRGGWTPEFNYDVNQDVDPINHPHLPCMLVNVSALSIAKLASTDKLNIHFLLQQDYSQGELMLCYYRYGAEEDSLYIDGQLYARLSGTGEGELQTHQIPLPAITEGRHTFSLTTTGGEGRHSIDCLQLQRAVRWKTLWQIGQPSGENTNSRVGIRPKQGGWTPEYDYVVETDADPINQPKLPCFLLSDEALTAAKLASTDKLNIHFQLFQDYQAGELLLLCDRYGAETDSVFIDGQLISEIVGIAEGELQQNSIPLPALASGEHRISLTTSGGTGRHAIDHLQLREANTSKTLWQIGKPHDESSDSRHGIRPMRGGWTPEFNYDVNQDVDPINHPHLPCMLVNVSALSIAKLASTDKLNIHFLLQQDYSQGELMLCYYRYGAEEDSLYIDGQLYAKLIGAGEGELQTHQIPLPTITEGRHTFSLTTTGGEGRHAIDFLTLLAVIQ